MMMKRRLLALALSLVLMTSLLPITAAAITHEEFLSTVNGITPNGTYCGDTYFTVSDLEAEGWSVEKVWWEFEGGRTDLFKDDLGRYKLAAGSGAGKIYIGFFNYNTAEQAAFDIGLTINQDHDWSAWTSNGDGTHSRSCENGCVEPPQTEFCADNNADCKCDDCGASIHFWQYTRTENSLTAECGNSGCTIGKVGVTLTASSVTLPNSPFNARLTFEGDFKEAFRCSDIEYRYEDPTTGWDYVDPNTFTPKPGNYQAGVLISGLPGKGEIAARSPDSNTGANRGREYLYVKYTAADPAITAQTGDDRPIELMMAGVLVFSALAAAAFVADSKRRSRQ